ncbi:citrate synthase [Pseudonocardia ailaonensis]|uniref:citrate synthase (unknown stereospecificity) n=1 Tax=Pseudonocardia ailaonensis TaxID=367279 RepID=A0ABN2MQM6_9PSEU
MSEDRLLTTAEVARRLDVKPDTVYAYVSRGLLTNVRAGDRRGSRFAQSEVDRLAGRGREARRPSGAIERIRTALTRLSDDDVFYRGRPVSVLAAEESAEAVAHLLWTGELRATRFDALPGQVAAARGAVAALPGTARLTDRIRVAVAAAAAADPLRHDLDPAAVVRRAEAILATVADALGPSPAIPRSGDPSDGAHDAGAPTRRAPTAAGPVPGDAGHDTTGPGSLAHRLWPALSGRPATPSEAALLTRLLVVMADHDLAVSTLAARVAASARAHPYAVVSAALGAIDGQYHGAASTLAHRFLAEALDDPIAAIAERRRAGLAVPGFGHRVYRRRDPRVEIVLAPLRAAGAPVVAVVDELAERLADRPGGFPNVDLALAAVAHGYGLPPDAGEAVFAVARITGWVAHALEEYTEPGLRFRAEGVYTGL